MNRKEYNRKSKIGWIGSQYCLSGNYIENPEYQDGKVLIFLGENNVELVLSKKQFKKLRKMIDEFMKYEGKDYD